MMDKLIDWLLSESDKRGLSQGQLARLMGMSKTNVNNVINGKINYSADFCIALASALNVSPERVLRLAGYLPPITATAESDRITQQIIDILRYMDDADKGEILSYAIYWDNRKKTRLTEKVIAG